MDIQNIPLPPLPPKPIILKQNSSFFLYQMVGGTILLFVGLMGGFYFGTKTQTQLRKTKCSKEAKICPDGSTVGRVGSNCEFSSCPEIFNKIVQIKGSAMLPTYQNNQYVTVARSPYINNKPQRGDIIIFKSLTNPDIEYIKRIIGLPGETVTIKNNVTLINSTVLNEPYLYEKSSTQTFPGGYMVEGVGKIVLEGEYFVMGDNRKHSSDSREFGMVPLSHITGKILQNK